jgi:DNA-binding MarR family transcriptional regulator
MTQPRWLDERESHLWRSWLRANQDLRDRLEDLVNRGSGLSAADYAVLVPLSESAEGRLRARDLRQEILWDRSRLSHHLGRMEKRGLVVREECETDARGAMVRITEAGRAAIEGAAPGHVEATRHYFFDLLSDDEVDMLTAVLDRVLAGLDAEAAELD